MTPRTRLLIVGTVALLFIGAGATALYCGVSYFQGKRLSDRAYREMAAGHYDNAIALYDVASHKMLESTIRALVYGNRGWCYTKKENDEQAIHDFTESIRIDPRPLYSVFDRGLAYVRKGEYEKARADLTTALQKDPNLTEAYFNRAWICMFKGEWDLAIADFSEAVRCDPREPQYYVDRGTAFAANEQIDPAIANFDSALGLNRAHAGAYIQRAAAYARKGNLEKGLKDITDAIHEMPKAPQLYYARGYIYLDRAVIDKAVEDLHEALRLRPGYDFAYLLLARAAMAERDWPHVLQNAERALDLNPKLAAGHFLRGRALTGQGKYDEAIAEFDQTLRMDASFLWALYFRAQNYAYRQEYSRALDELHRTAERFPKAEIAHLALGWFRATCPHDAYRDGREAVDETIKGCEISHWRNWYALDALGAAYAELGDFEQAKKFANLALTLPGVSRKDRALVEQRLARYEVGIAVRDLGGADTTPTLFEEAISAYAHGDFDRAIRCLNLVLPPNPGTSVSAAIFHFFDGTHDRKDRPPWAARETVEMTNGFYYRGLAFEKRREWPDAIADFSTTIWREPNSRLALVERSVCYERLGEPERAFRDLDEMLRRDPDDALAYALRADILEMEKQSAAAGQAATRAIELDPKLPLPHDVRSRIYAAENELDKADREFSEAERLDPDRVREILGPAYLFERRRDYKRAGTEFRETVERFPRSANAQNALAWFLATCPDRAQRNATQALSHATMACELSKWNEPGYVDTLAAAYAESGDFDRAVNLLADALSKAAPDLSDREQLERHLVFFKRKEPWRANH